MKIVIGSRGSQLALKQTEFVKNLLQEAYPEHTYEIKVIHTMGDKIQNIALDKMNDKGIFVKEIEKELREKTIDLAVHSLKDMPSTMSEGLVYAKTVKPSDYRDCLVLKNVSSLDQLPLHSVIATGSKRRKYQLLAIRPDLEIVGIRGNVNTRLEKMYNQDIDGLVLASAGLERLGMSDLISEYLDETRMIPACGQGILALQVCENSPLIKMFDTIGDDQTQLRMELECLFLAEVNGGCHIPVGSYAHIEGEQIHFYALLGDEQGHCLERRTAVFSREDAYQEVKTIAKQLKESVYGR